MSSCVVDSTPQTEDNKALAAARKLVKRQVELLLDPFLWYVKLIYPEMR
jgi:hypothetical protein